MPGNPWCDRLSIDEEVLRAFVNEIVGGADRLGADRRLEARLDEFTLNSLALGAAARRVSIFGALTLNDLVNFPGGRDDPANAARFARVVPPPPGEPCGLPESPREMDRLRYAYLFDWIRALEDWPATTRAAATSGRHRRRREREDGAHPRPPRGATAMKTTQIALRDLDPRAGGKAELTLDFGGPVSDRLSVSIRRGAANRSFLGPDGWQQAEHFFDAELVAPSDGKLVVVLGPAVVDNALRDFDVVEMSFPEADLVGQVVWEGITRSIALTAPPTAPPPAPPSSPPPSPPSPPPPPPAPPPPPSPPPPPPPPPPSRRLLWLLLLALLLAGAGGAWWLTRDTAPMDTTATVPTPAPPPTPTPALSPPPAPTPAPKPTPPPAPTPAEAHERGLAALEAGDCAAAATAFAPALAADYGPTLLTFAGAQDLRDFEPCLFETSNDVRALANYEKACQAEAPEAKAALAGAARRPRAASRRGDAVAGEVLRVAAPKALAACGG